MKKRMLALLLALLMLGATATAETLTMNVRARDITVSDLTDVLIYRAEDADRYMLITPDGQPLTEAIYADIRPANNYPFFRMSVPAADGIHDEGLLDLQGQVVIPPEYADIEIASDRWQMGIRLTPSTSDDKDYTVTNYSNNEKSFYRIDSVDFFFRGRKVGTLGRSDYGQNYCTPRGDYICVVNRAGERAFYNGEMQKSPYPVSSSVEYDSKYESGMPRYYHQGSGQEAFVPGCTLREDEVESDTMYYRGVVYGLQGQELFKAAQNYDNVRAFHDGYARVSMNGLQGLIDRQGNEVIPVEYDDMDYEPPVRYGYVGVTKDGKFGFVDLSGHVTCDFVYSADVVDERGVFATIQNLDGTIIVLSAAVGELPEHYQEVSFPDYNGCLAFIATNTSGQLGVVDLYGNALLPFSDDYRSIYLNRDATMAVAYYGDMTYTIYRMDPPALQPQAPVSAPAQSDDGSWTCPNGHAGNTGNFCGECGAPRPTEQPAACPNCGYEFEDGSVPNFCPNCGAPQNKG